jgi:hypothetical protein
MRWLIVAASLFALGCSSVQPLKIAAGDRCFRCGRTIEDVRLAGEVIDKRGHALKFRTAGCMAKYLAGQPADTKWRGDLGHRLRERKVREGLEGDLRPRPGRSPNTNERDFAAFSSPESCRRPWRVSRAAPRSSGRRCWRRGRT